MDSKMSAFILCFTGLLMCASLVASATLETINGELVQVVDNCTVGVDSTCPSEHCCVSQNLVYPPDNTGPEPTRVISCNPYLKQGEFCYIPASNYPQACPCATSLTCTKDVTFAYGHCV